MQQVTTDHSAYNNSWYNPGSLFKRISWLVINSLFFNNSLAIFNGLKCALVRLYGGKVGKDVLFKPSINIKYPWFLHIGDHVWIGEKVWIDNLALVTIGNHVNISQGAMLLTGNHDFSKSTFDLIVQPITLHEGVWIGAKAIVCPGVQCNSHAVLAVNSVATKDLEPYTIYQGNPAVKIRERKIT